MEVFRLSDLALVARTGVPSDVVVEVRPPEANEQVSRRRKHSFVSESVRSEGDESETVSGFGNELGMVSLLSAKQLVLHEEVSRGLAQEVTVLFLVKVGGSLECP
jgi:hypothetical protein